MRRIGRSIALGSAAAVALFAAGAPLAPAASAQAAAATLYVSPHGVDSATCGTVAKPCRTIQQVVANAPPGGTIIVERGTYDVSVGPTATNPYGGIDLDKPLTIRSRSRTGRRTGVTVVGTGPIFTLYNPGAPDTGVSGVTIEGLSFRDVTGSGYNGVITVPGYGAGNVTVRDNHFRDITEEAIGYHGNPGLNAPLGTGWAITGNLVEGVTHQGRSGMFLGDLSDSVVRDNVVADTGHAGIVLTGLGPGTEAGNQIIDNRVSNVPYEGIQVAFGADVLVSGNTVTAAGTSGSTVGNASGIMLFDPGQTNVTVVDNRVSDSYVDVAVGQLGTTADTETLGTGDVILLNNLLPTTGGAGVENNTASQQPLNAVLDWWGCPTGPNTPGCSTTQGPVGFTPWRAHAVTVHRRAG